MRVKFDVILHVRNDQNSFVKTQWGLNNNCKNYIKVNMLGDVKFNVFLFFFFFQVLSVLYNFRILHNLLGSY